jgi:hypothetical protein
VCIDQRTTPKTPTVMRRIWIVTRDGDDVLLFWSRLREECEAFAQARTGDKYPLRTESCTYYVTERRTLTVTWHGHPHLLRLGQPVPY